MTTAANRSYKLIYLITTLLILRSIHLFIHYSPPGIDITLLGDMIRIYVENWQRGTLIPTNLMPLFGESPFFKFHSILAPILASLEYFLKLDLIHLLKLVTFSGFFLYDVSVLLLIKDFDEKWQRSKNGISINALICFLLINYATGVPGRYMGSGGGVYIFGAALAILGTREFLYCCFAHQSTLLNAVKTGVYFILSILVHSLSIVFQPFFFLFLVFIWFSVDEVVACLKQKISNILLSLLIIGLLCLPVLYLTYNAPSELLEDFLVRHIANVRKGYSHYPAYLASSKLLSSLGAFFFYLLKQFPHFVVLSLLIPILGKEKRKIQGAVIVLLFTVFAWTAEALPLIGLAMYPDRLTQFVAITWGILLLKQQYFSNFKVPNRFKKLLVFCTLFFVLGLSAVRFAWNYCIQPFNSMYLTRTDAESIRKIAPLIKPDSVIRNRYRGASVWIPALIGKPITEAHVHIADMEGWKTYQNKLLKNATRYIFIDSQCMKIQSCKKRCAGKKILFSENGTKLCQ